MRWPFFTGELKSANNSWMRPDTWLPTSTVTTACRLPEVLTRETTSAGFGDGRSGIRARNRHRWVQR